MANKYSRFLIHEATHSPVPSWDVFLGARNDSTQAIEYAKKYVSRWAQDGDKIVVNEQYETTEGKKEVVGWSIVVLTSTGEPTDYGAAISIQHGENPMCDIFPDAVPR